MDSMPEHLERLLASYVRDRLIAGHRPAKIYAELYSAYALVLGEAGSTRRKAAILSAMEAIHSEAQQSL